MLISRERNEDKTQHTGILCHLKQDNKDDVATHLPGLAVPHGQFMVQYKAFLWGFLSPFQATEEKLMFILLQLITLVLGAA